ncbi:polymorphic toxin type 46 domain-containing protein [Aeromonas tecta]|uniref:polymorphic toxin type 46 domain-containing protein n=1 Tax=Aeromonas tecta TaxID=324617 RepID=UPI000681E057|nr:polymorphic toxin type 46 domain-containing protein [Aeromonas tecta]
MNDAGQAVFNQVLADYRNALTEYRKDAESFFLGDMLSMDMEQTIKVGDKTITTSSGSNKTQSVVTQCPLSGTLRLVHLFESVRFIPIGNTPYKVEAGKMAGKAFISEVTVKEGSLDAKGIAEVGQLTPGKSYRVTFYPNVKKSDLDTLFASYAPVQKDLEAWLTQEWNGEHKAAWGRYNATGGGLASHSLAAASGIGKALVGVWDDLKTIYELLADPVGNAKKLAEFGVDAAAMAEAGASQMEAAMLVLQDEALLYLYAYALVSWVKLLPPDEQTEFGAQVIASVLIDVIVGVVLTGGAGLAVRYSVKAAGAAKKQARMVVLVTSLISMSKKHNLAQHAQSAKKVLVAGVAPLNPAKKADLRLVDGGAMTEVVRGTAAKRKFEAHTEIKQVNNTPDASTPARTPSDQAHQPEAQTCTNGCPVSMVTGEELLALEDAQLPGMLPFTFGRLYRTSAVEQECGMGPGWSHSLAHRLERHGETLTWWDDEALAIELPLPSTTMPMATNRLSGAAVYLGDEADEVILAKAGSPFLHFTWQGRAGRLTAISDGYGNRLTVRPDAEGRPSWIEHDGGLALRLVHQDSRLVAIELQQFDGINWQPQAILQRYHYDDAGHLVATENGAGEGEQYRYRSDGVILERRLAGGAGFFWQWEGEGNKARAIRHWSDSARFDVSYGWDDDKGEVTVNNADGSLEVYQHDRNARLVRQQDPDGAVTEFDYNDKGQKILARDAMAAETHYHYDDAGLLCLEISPDGSETSYSYWDGRVRKVVQGEREWRFERNEQGDVIARVDPLGRETRYGYTAQGKLSWVAQPDGSRIELVWNRLGQLIEEKGADGGLTRWRYDERGRQILQRDPRGAITRYEWDAADRLRAVHLPGGGSRRFEYNPYDKVTAEWDELGRETRYEYHDRLHLLSRRINPDGSELKYRYDNAKLFLSEIENEHGEQHRIQYHPNGLVAEETGFDGRTIAYRYDLTGHLCEKVEFGKQGSELVTSYERDAMGRLLKKQLPDGREIQFAYDQYGQLTRVDDGVWPLAFEYDRGGNLVAEHQGWATSYFKHDAMGQLAQWRLPDGNRLDYHYQDGALSGIDLNGSELTRHQVAAGLEMRRRQGALTQQYEYDEQGRLTALRLHRGQQVSRERRYGYDRSGNLLRVNDSAQVAAGNPQGEQHYRYDPLDRLLEVRGELTERFMHDPAGNLLSQTQGNQFEPARTQGNRLLFSGDRHFEYDEFGRLATERRGKEQRLVTRYEYDCQHQLIGAELPDGRRARYDYDAFGRRIRKTVIEGSDEQVTEFLWQANNLIAESCSDGAYRSFIYEPGSFKPLVQLEGEGKQAEVYHYQLDHLGTPLALTHHDGHTAWQVRYRAYGNVWKQELAEVETPLRFQGQYYDAETGLHYNRHRYYQPDTGRFITPDPIGLAGGLNNYQYAPNPTGWVDPLGLMFKAANCTFNITRRTFLNNKFGRTGDINADINQRARKKIAFDFYKKQGFSEESIPSHLHGIDFSQDVTVETINRGKKVYQYQSSGAPQGNYYAIRGSTTPSELGIGEMGENRAKGTVELKLKKQYISQEKTKVLRSTSKAIDDTWSVRGKSQPSSGGGTQMFTTERDKFKEVTNNDM